MQEGRAARGWRSGWPCGACFIAWTACTPTPPPSASAGAVQPGPLATSPASASGSPLAPPAPAVPAPSAARALPPVRGRLVGQFPHSIEPAVCVRAFVAVARGRVELSGAALAEGDVAVLTHPGPEPVRVVGEGLLAVATVDLPHCAVLSRPVGTTEVVRAAAAAPLTS